jgi:hypothetical protein
MKSILVAAVLFAGRVWAADEVADRTAIEKAIRAFTAFTDDFDRSELAAFAKPAAMAVTVQGVPGELAISKGPWGMTVDPITVKKIRFLTPDVAMVDAAQKGPELIVLKKVGTDWKIASLRILAEK